MLLYVYCCCNYCMSASLLLHLTKNKTLLQPSYHICSSPRGRLFPACETCYLWVQQECCVQALFGPRQRLVSCPVFVDPMYQITCTKFGRKKKRKKNCSKAVLRSTSSSKLIFSILVWCFDPVSYGVYEGFRVMYKFWQLFHATNSVPAIRHPGMSQYGPTPHTDVIYFLQIIQIIPTLRMM